MSSFKVSTEDLQAFASQLSGLVGELGDAGGFSPDFSAAGSPRVESMLESFFAEWSDGLLEIQDNINQLTGRLSGAGEEYDGTDQAIATAFQPG